MSDLTPSITSTSEFLRPIEVTVITPQRKHYALYTLLLLGTMFTTLVVGAHIEFNFLHGAPAFLFNDEAFSLFPIRWVLAEPSRFLLGIPFAATLMLILFAHEMGHYLACKHYKVQATLPFFIPFPTFFGTMGAFIRIRSQIQSRAALFDIGIAGPIAGFVVAVAALFIALPLSRAGAPLSDSLTQLGCPLIFHLGLWFIPVRDVHGVIAPLQSVYFHPMAIAAWVGMFATALNLLPGGQLDGGHIVYALAPRAHRFVSWASIGALLPLAVFGWTGWLLWAILLWLTGVQHPFVPEDPNVKGWRRWIALSGAVLLILTFMPAPITHGSLWDIIPQLRSGH